MQRSLLLICFICVLLLFFVGFFRPITSINQDLGRHLLLGKIIVEGQGVPQKNLLSYTNPNYFFINSHWLSEVIFYVIFSKFGFEGLLIFSTGIAILTFFLMFFFIIRHYALTAVIIPLFLFVLLLLGRTDIRPEIFSYLFLSIWIVLLYSYRENTTKWIFIFIPLEVLWVNMHIYFFVGIAVLFLFFIDLLRMHNFRWSKPVKMLGLVFLFAAAGTFINPYGLQGALFPLAAQGNYGLAVQENQSVWTLLSVYRVPGLYFFVIAVFFILMVLFLHRRKARIVDWLLVVTFSFACAGVYRNVSLFVYATVIPFVSAMPAFLKLLTVNLKRYTGRNMARFLVYYGLLMLALAIMGQIAGVVRQQSVGFGVREYGKKSVDFILANHIQDRLYNDFNIGGYLAYRIYPAKVFVDNRPEAYPKSFFQDVYQPIQANPALFTKMDTKYKFNAVFLQHWDGTPWENKFLRFMLNNPQYTLVYIDDYVVILVKNKEENKSIIQKYAITERSFFLDKTVDRQTLVRYIFLFEKIGWQEQEKRAYKRLSKIDPNNCALAHYLGYVKSDSKVFSFNTFPQIISNCQ